VLQQHLQQQTANHEIFAKEGLQKHVYDRFSELALETTYLNQGTLEDIYGTNTSAIDGY
jgi:hypothetical protein